VPAQAPALCADELAPSAAGPPVGVVGVVEESACATKGADSVGVARPHPGRLGPPDHGQVGVFLLGVTPAGSALLDHRLVLPESGCAATGEPKDRRAKAHVPEGQPFRTQPQIAAELVRPVAVRGAVERDGVVAEEESGRAGRFLAEWALREPRYVLEGPVPTAVGTADPAACIPACSGRGRQPTAPARDAVGPVAALAAELPASAWQALQVRAGVRGPLVFEFATVRVWSRRHRQPGPPAWLLIRRSWEDEPEVKSSLSHAEAEIPLSPLALVACTRCRVEEFFGEAKSYLGRTQHETRSYVGWPHPLSLVGLAHLVAILARKRLPNKCRS
jgi:SRSO17 transposase